MASESPKKSKGKKRGPYKGGRCNNPKTKGHTCKFAAHKKTGSPKKKKDRQSLNRFVVENSVSIQCDNRVKIFVILGRILDEREEPKLLDSFVRSDMTTARFKCRSNLHLILPPQA
jgi:hypothetical protein